VRRISITAVLLILVLVPSASACVAGWGSPITPSCPRTISRRDCTRKETATATIRGRACGEVLKSLPARCGMRSFIQFQFVSLAGFEIAAPIKRTASNPVAFDSVVVVSSIGSPETDRGPPIS
jgi:hypothetical protein